MRTSTKPIRSALIALAAGSWLGAAPAAATVVEERAPSFEISRLDDGSRLLEWVSPTPWNELADEVADVLSVPVGKAAFANALILGPRVNLEEAIEEVEEVETPAETPPVLRYDYRDLFGAPSLRGPIDLKGPAEESTEDEEQNDETTERNTPRIETDDGDDPRDTPPPTIYGEEIGDRKTYELSYKFFAGDTKEKTAKRRIKGARKSYVPAFGWWKSQINDNCSFDVEFKDLGDDTKTLTHEIERKGKKKTVGYSGYTTHAKWARAPKYSWIVGRKQRDALLRSEKPRQRFHLAIFKPNGIRWMRSGKESRAQHVLTKPGIGIFRKPLLNPLKTAIHETGHFLGLKDGDGAIMTYASKAAQKGGSQYGEKKFRKSWCTAIEASVKGAGAI